MTEEERLEERRRLVAAAASIEAWIANGENPVSEEQDLRRDAALRLMKAMEARYRGLPEFVELVESLASAATGAVVAQEAGTPRVVSQEAEHAVADALTPLMVLPKNFINADDPRKVVRAYAALARIASA